MTTNNIINLEIDEKAYSYAKIYSSLLNDEFQRKRSYASLVALYALINELEKTDKEIQKSMTLFRNPLLNENYEISDLYVNNWHIDVRILVEGENCLIPKIHFDCDIVPDYYAVVRINKELDKAELLGFATPDKVEKEIISNAYYVLNTQKLISYNEFLSNVNMQNIVPFTESDHEEFKKSYLGLLDGEIDDNLKNRLIKHLLKCSSCRTEFCCFTGFEMVSCNMSAYPNMLEDLTLNIIGAQAVDNEKYVGKEEKIQIVDDIETIVDDISEQENSKDNKQNTSDDEQKNDENLDDEIIEEKDIPYITSDMYDELEKQSEEQIAKEQAQLKQEKSEEIQNSQIKTTDENTNNPINNEETLEEYEEPQETVSDILDELFNIEEETLPIQEIPEKQINTSNIEPINDNSIQNIEDSDDNFIDSSQSSEIEVIEDVEIEPYQDSDIEVIEDTLSDLQESDPEEIELIESDTIEDMPLNIEINNASTEDIEIIETAEDIIEKASDESEKTVQQVIVDYDEFGEPVYSYVTNVPQQTNDLEQDSTDIESVDSIDDSIVDESNQQEDEQHNDNLSNDENIESANDIDDEPIQITTEKNLNESNEAVSNNKINEEDIVDNIEDVFNDDEIVSYNDETDKEDEQIDPIDNVDETEEQDEEFEEYEESEENVETEPLNAVFESDDNFENQEDTVQSEENSSAEYQNEDDEEYEEEIPNKKNGGVLASILIVIVFAVLGAGGFVFLKNKNNIEEIVSTQENNSPNINTPAMQENEEPPVQDMFESLNNSDSGLEITTPNIPEQNDDSSLLPPPPPSSKSNNSVKTDVKKTVNTVNPKDINHSIASAFSNGGNRVVLRGINWLCSPQLFSDAQFKIYLQSLDNVLRLNLRKNILDVVEIPSKNSVTVKISVDNNRNLDKVIISETSGSKQVDNIVLQSINETFEGEKSPILTDGAQKADIYYLKLVIKL